MGFVNKWMRKRKPAPDARERRLPLPPLHDGVTYDDGLEAGVLSYIGGLVTSTSVTAETGPGVSTVVLAGTGCEHYTIASSEAVVEAVRQQCRERSIDDRNVRFSIGHSQDILPGLALPDLDLAIINGARGMPVPIVEWCYLAPRLKVGGVLIVDDVWIWTNAVLCDFMRAEWQWEVAQAFGKAMAFRKKSDPVVTDWGGQPFVASRSNVPVTRQWSSDALHGLVTGIDSTLDLVERQGDMNKDTIDALLWVEGELLDSVRRIEGLCATKAKET